MAQGPGRPKRRRTQWNTQAVLNELHHGQEHESHSSGIWEVIGGSVSSVAFRFGDQIDYSRFHAMRYIAIIDFVWIPFMLSFGQMASLKPLWLTTIPFTLDVLLNAFYAFGMILMLSTSVVDITKGFEYVDPFQILILNLSSPKCWLDIASMIGTFWPWSPVPYIAALRLLRSWRLSSNVNDVYQIHMSELTDDPVTLLVELNVGLALIMHVFACAWFAAMTLELDDWERKLEKDPRFMGGSLYSVYLCYFADGASMLVGWGGPLPSSADGVYTHSELVVWSVAAPVAALSNAFVFAQLLDLVKRVAAATSKHLERLDKLSQVFDSLRVPRELKRRCLRYMAYVSIHNANRTEYQQVFSSLSLELQQEIKLHLFDSLVTNAPFFDDVPAIVVMDMVMSFEQDVYGPGKYIMTKGEYGSDLFFILKGSAEVLVDEVTVVSVKEVGDYFGEVALVFDLARTASVRARSFCIVAKLSREDFEKSLERAPGMREQIVEHIARCHIEAATPGRREQAQGEMQPLLSEERQRDLHGLLAAEDRTKYSPGTARSGAKQVQLFGQPPVQPMAAMKPAEPVAKAVQDDGQKVILDQLVEEVGWLRRAVARLEDGMADLLAANSARGRTSCSPMSKRQQPQKKYNR
eukprot:TRINITY_DN21605_c0_g3_i2.p1 TRINITY_DN21605_c0_g3~~TRINITY_DN21605_c0_g3_i2.p1  ORF type:complete len:636 (+),score=138.38 TRINITY_DN21605_c0_g3_i2:1702-3609(+)